MKLCSTGRGDEDAIVTSSRGSSRRSRAKAASKISIVRDPTDDVTVDGSATPPMMSPSAQDDQVCHNFTDI